MSTGGRRIRKTDTRGGVLLSPEKEVLAFATTWLDFAGIVPSEISQRRTNTV